MWLSDMIGWGGMAIVVIAAAVIVIRVVAPRPRLTLGSVVLLLAGLLIWLGVLVAQLAEADHRLLESRAQRAGQISAAPIIGTAAFFIRPPRHDIISPMTLEIPDDNIGEGGPKEAPSFEQLLEYDCGPAALKSALHRLGIRPPAETDVAAMLGTTEDHGTDLKNFTAAAEEFGLECRSGHDGTIEDLERLLAEGYVVLLEYTLPDENIGHFGVLQKIEGGNISLWQPAAMYDMEPIYSLDKFQSLWHEGQRFHGKHGGYVALRKKAAPLAENS